MAAEILLISGLIRSCRALPWNSARPGYYVEYLYYNRLEYHFPLARRIRRTISRKAD